MARREQFNVRELKVETIKALDDATGMTFGTTGDGFDFTLWGTTAGSKFFWDESLDKVIMDNADIQLGDNDELRFGDLAAGDWVIKFDGSDLSIMPASAVEAMIVGGTSYNTNVTLKGTFTVGVDDTGYDVRLYGATAGSSFKWDQTNDKAILTGADIQVSDSDEVRFGSLTAGDVVAKFDGTDFSIVPASASEGMLLGADSYLLNTTLKGTLTVGKSGTGHDVIFYSDTPLSNMTWTNASDKLVFDGADVQINDSDELRFGDLAAGDWVIKFDGSDFSITPASASESFTIGANSKLANTTLKGTFTVGQDDTGHDVQLFGATSGSYFKWDQTNDKATFIGADVQVGDSDEVRFGTLAAGDIVAKFNGTDFSIVPASASEGMILGGASNALNTTLYGTLTVGVDDTGYNVKLFGATASSYALWDQTNDKLITNAADIQVIDNDELRFGTLAAGDVVMKFTGTDMSIVPASASEGLLIGGSSNLFNTTLRGTLTIGAASHGTDVRIYGQTNNAFMEYDASDDSLEFTLGRIEFISGKAGATVLKFADDAGAVCADIATAVGTVNSIVKITVGATTAYLSGHVSYVPA